MNRSGNGPDLSVIIPTYNAEDYIGPSLQLLIEGLAPAGVEYEILLIDDGSTDATASLLEATHRRDVRLIRNGRNQGKGAAIKKGIRAARGKRLVMTDADIPYGVEGILECERALREGADVVVGDRTLPASRVVTSVSGLRRAISATYRSFLRASAGRGHRDIQCGLKGLQVDFARRLAQVSKIDRFAFDLEIVILADRLDVTVEAIAVHHVRNGPSSIRPLRDPLLMLWDVLRILLYERTGRYSPDGVDASFQAVTSDGASEPSADPAT